MIKRFVIYGLLGWIIEVFWTGLSSLINGDMRLIGFTNLWMFFIYGSAIILEPIHDRISQWGWLARGMVWVVLIFAMEYSSGLLLYSLLDVHPWFYTGPFAVQGLIRLDFAPAWFLAGLFFERTHRWLDYYRIA